MENLEELTMKEITIWIEEELKDCGIKREEAIKNAEAAIEVRDFYGRRIEFLNKILDWV